MNKVSLLVLSALAAGGLSACAVPGLGGGDYNRGQVRGEQSVRLATVVSVREVRIEGTHSGVGTLAGAVAGGVAGGAAGSGRGNGVAAVGGAIVGGLLGNAIEQSSTAQRGVEVTVQYDNGRLSAITQAADEAFKVGDRVVVNSGGGVTRVTKVAAGSVLNTLPPPPGSAPPAVPPTGSAPPAAAPAPMVPPPGSAPSSAVDMPGTSASVGTRWFCPGAGYYPEVATCTQTWLKVAQ